jgi:hypothetical protein
MAKRGECVAEAGRFKADPAAVGAPRRGSRRSSPGSKRARRRPREKVAERSYRAMIAAFEDFEREEWTRRNAGGAAPLK